MVGFARSRDVAAGEFRFRVSDALTVPLRGYLLRLRLLEGDPNLDDLRPGRRLRLVGPDGEERLVRVEDFSITGGRATRKRLAATREVDVLISEKDAIRDGRRIGIGWTASGPVV